MRAKRWRLWRRLLCRWWKYSGLRSRAAITITAVWVLWWAAYLLTRYELSDLWSGAPNLIGDFLSGTVAPLAFFWLVLGYLQQSDELRLQRKELALQRRE